MADALATRGLTWEGHVRELRGRLDFVFRADLGAVFVDGDFWHGWRFPQWREKLPDKRETKIAATRRDARNHRCLRRMGWKVVQIWEHPFDRSREGCLLGVLSHLQPREDTRRG